MAGAYSIKRRRKGDPCPICGSQAWCVAYTDGTGHVLCMRFHRDAPAVPHGWKAIGKMGGSGGQRFAPTDGTGNVVEADPAAAANWRAKAAQREKQAEAFRQRAIESAKFIWGRCRGPSGVNHPRLVAYIESRGVPIAELPERQIPPTIRFCSALEHYSPSTEAKTTRPALLAMMKNAKHEVVCLQRIYLDDQTPGKARDLADSGEAKMMKGSAAGAACRLCPPAPGGVLVLCEGIETALALLAAVKDRAAVWACMSEGGLRSIELPPEMARPGGAISTVIVAADFDRIPKRSMRKERPGEVGARICVNVLRARHPHLRIGLAMPSDPAVVGELVDAAGEVAGDAKSVDWLDVYRTRGGDVVREAVLERCAWISEGRAAAAGDEDAPFDHESPAPDENGDAAADVEDPARPRFKLIDDVGATYGCGGDRETKAIALLMDRFAPETEPERARSVFTLAYYQGRYFEWLRPDLGDPKWEPLDDNVLKAEATRTLDRYWIRKHKSNKPYAPSQAEVLSAVNTAISYVGVLSESAPCWLPPTFDAAGKPVMGRGLRDRWRPSARVGVDDPPVEMVIAARNGLLDVRTLLDGKPRMAPCTPRFFSLTCLPFDIDTGILQRGLDEDEDNGISMLLDPPEREGLCPNFMRLTHQLFGVAQANNAARDAQTASERRTAAEKLEEALEVEACAQELAGLTLLSRHGFEVIGALDGVSGAGKDTWLDAIEAATGPGNCGILTFPTMGGRFDTASIVGKLMLRMSEWRVGRIDETAAAMDTLLRISSKNPVRTEGKGKDANAYAMVTGTVWISMNGFPKQLRDDAAAIVRRLVILPCHAYDGTPDPNLKSKVKAEAPYVLLWMLEGLRRVLKRGKVNMPAAGQRARGEIERQLSPVRAFVEDFCVLGEGQSVACHVLRDVFKYEAKAAGNTGLAEMSDQTFGVSLRAAVRGRIEIDRAMRGGRADREHFYVGIRLLEPRDYEDVDRGGQTVKVLKNKPETFAQTQLPAPWANDDAFAD